VAHALRERLGLPLLAKDAIKETLGEPLGIIEAGPSRQLGIATFELLRVLVRELLGNGVSLIAEGNFVPGRTTVFDDLPPARVVQVHLSAPPETLRERLHGRDATRHPVHYDRVAAAEIHERAGRGEWHALPLAGELIAVDTTSWPDVPALVEQVAAAVSAARSD
jgi:predicted kinase